MSPLRFCMMTTFYPPYAFGGDAMCVYGLSNMLARRGHTVDVIHCVDSYRALAREPPLTAYRNEPGVTVHGLVSGVGALSPLATQQSGYPLFKGRKIRAILAAKRFDVLHFHNISLLGGPLLLGYGEGVKLYTTHEHWLVCPTHVLFKFQREACVQPSCFRCTLIHHRPPQLWRSTGMLRAALRHVDAFLAPSLFTMRRHLADGLDVPFVHLPPCVAEMPAEPLPPLDHDTPRLPAAPFFLFVGRLEKLKGLHTVIPLFRDYKEAHLVIAGEGGYAPTLKQLAAGCERIHFLGALTPWQLWAVYAQAIALVVPSITFETFGQVIIEAYAARTPVIARDLGPFPEIMAESGGGLLFHTEAELLQAMQRLRTDRALRDRLGEAGYAAYRARWTEEAHLQRYLGLIEELRERKGMAACRP